MDEIAYLVRRYKMWLMLFILTDETLGSLLGDFHAERARHVRFITVALHGYIAGLVEPLVSAAGVFFLVLR